MPFDVNFNNPYAQSRMFNIFGNQAPQRIMPQAPPQMAPQTIPQPSKRLFSSTIPTPNPVQSGIDEGNGGDDLPGVKYFDLLQQLGANRPQQTAYEDALRNPPQQADYNPSWKRKLAAALIGGATGASAGPGAAIAAAEHIGSAPYERAIQDYQHRTEAARVAAEMEHANISDYRENLKAGAQLGIAGDTARIKSFEAAVDARYKGAQARNMEAQRENEYKKAEDQAQRWLTQSRNEKERNDIQRLLAGIQARNADSLAQYRQITGAAAQTSAGAAVTSAGAAQANARANQTRADKYEPPAPRLPEPNDVGEATDLAMEQMSHDPKYARMFTANTTGKGPAFTINEAYSTPTARAELQKRINALLKASYPKYGGTSETLEDVNPFTTPRLIFGNEQ